MKRKTRNRKRKHIKKRNIGGASYSPRARSTIIDAASDPDLSHDLKMALTLSSVFPESAIKPSRRRSASFTTSYMRKKNSNSHSTVKQKRNTPNGAPRIYHPTLDIEFDSEKNTYQMKPFNYKYDLPLPLSAPDQITGVYKSPVTDKYHENEEDVKNQQMIRTINVNPSDYRYLAPNLYDLLDDADIKKTEAFAYALVIGRLRDELIPFMRITNPDIIRMRLGLSKDDAIKVISIIRIVPSIERTELTPTGDLSPGSIARYNAHPMFIRTKSTPQLETVLAPENVSKQDNVLVLAHGTIGKKLSPHMTELANKYFRIIELGVPGQILGMTQAPFIELNKALRNVDETNDYGNMFENTRVGDEQRQKLFSNLSQFFRNNENPISNATKTFNLVNITHDRILSGDQKYDVRTVRDDHKITYKSMQLFASMGIFSPVDYENDTSTNRLSKKELFKLYPNTAFLTSGKQIELIRTLLPYAVQTKTRINIIIAACGGMSNAGRASVFTAYPINSNSNLIQVGKRYLFVINDVLSTLLILHKVYEKYFESKSVEYREYINTITRVVERIITDNNFDINDLDHLDYYFTLKHIFEDADLKNGLSLHNLAGLDIVIQKMIRPRIFLIKEFYSITMSGDKYNLIKIQNTISDDSAKLSELEESDFSIKIYMFLDKMVQITKYITNNKASLLDNPALNQDLDTFYRDAADSFIYKYKPLPNYDDAINRRQSIKKKLYDQNRVKSRVKGDRRFDLSL
jgi:hypothetical protein